MRPGRRDTLRLEAAMPLYGHELSEEIDPFQAGLGWAVKLDKGDFLGQAALERRRQDEARCDTRRPGTGGQAHRPRRQRNPCRRARKSARACSGTFAPTLQKAIAMAYVDPEFAAVVRPGRGRPRQDGTGPRGAAAVLQASKS